MSKTFSNEQLLEIARRQKAILYQILISIGLIIGWVGMVAAVPERRGLFAIVTFWVVSIIVNAISAVLIYRLAKALRRTAWVYTLAAFVPYVGVIALLMINAGATRAVRQAGLHVGLLGARRAELHRLAAESDANSE
jgi:hypothetical protein